MKITDIEAIGLRAILKEPIYFGGQPPFTVKSPVILKRYTDEGVMVPPRRAPDVNRDIQTVRLTRKAVGRGFLIMVDANSNYDLTDATKLAQTLEEPIPTRDISHYGDLALRTIIPLAAGESEPMLCRQKDLITRGGVRVLQPNVTEETHNEH